MTPRFDALWRQGSAKNHRPAHTPWQAICNQEEAAVSILVRLLSDILGKQWVFSLANIHSVYIRHATIKNDDIAVSLVCIQYNGHAKRGCKKDEQRGNIRRA